MPSINTKQYDGIKPLVTPEHGCITYAGVDINFPSTAFAGNDLIRLAPLPSGVKLVDYAFVFPDIDSGTALVWSFGELNAAGTDLATVYVSGVTTGQAAGVYRAVNDAHLASNSGTDRRLAIKVTTAAGTYTGSGKVGKAILGLEG